MLRIYFLSVITINLIYSAEGDDCDGFSKKFGKIYSSSSDKKYRCTIFAANKHEIDLFNKEGHSYQKGLNQFSDLTPEERSAFTGFKLDKDDNQYGQSLTSSDDAFNNGNSNNRLLQNNTLDSFTPRSIDWAASGKVTAVKNQGQCGSCWAFAVVGAIESFQLNKGKSNDYSEQQLVDCTKGSPYNNYGCNGGGLRNTLEYTKSVGLVQESNYAYTAKDGQCLNTAAFSIDQILSYDYVRSGYMSNLLKAISTGTVAVAFSVTNSFYSYKTGVYDSKKGCTDNTPVNHAVLAVGYDLDAPTPYIKFKNSWGTGWGESGYFKMSFKNLDSQPGPCKLLTHNQNSYVTGTK